MSNDKTPRHDAPNSLDEQRAEKRLDDAIAALRAESSSSADESDSLQRVWARLESAAAAPRGSACAELREQLPALVAGRLEGPKAALLQAHARECLPCRRAQKEEQDRAAGVSAASASAAPATGGRSWIRFAAAAAVIVAAVGLGQVVMDRLSTPSPAGAARIVDLEGTMFSPDNGATVDLSEGSAIEAGRWLRTGKDSRARIELADGSLVEMNERSQLLVRETGDATTVRLRRGGVIVEAAPRKQRNLFVQTDEMSVAVKGTIFSVQHGLQGSSVGVIEGSVQVEAGRDANPLLQPGEQLSSRRGQPGTDLRRQLKWSRQYEQYSTLLDELEAVQASLAKRPFEHRVRYSTELLDAMPAGTVFYAALPNNSANLRRFVELVTERLDGSPELAEWWQSQAARQGAQGQPTFEEMLDALETLSDSLGEEVVIGLVLPEGESVEPVPFIVSQLRDETALRDLVDTQIGERVRAEGGSFAGLGNRDSLVAAATSGTNEVRLATAGGAVLVGPSAPVLLGLADRLESGGGAFAGSDFHRTLSAEYLRGAETLIGFDLASLIGRQGGAEFGGATGPVLQAAGFDDLEHFIFRSDGEQPGSAVLSFSDRRDGLASWLAAPAPMGSLEFVSPQATLLVSAVFEDPETMLKDLQDIVGTEDFAAGLASFRAETGIDPFSDIAAPLGGEMTIALDGPLFPTPAWKAIFEVYDPARLQQTISSLVDRQNQWAKEQAAQQGTLIEPIVLESFQDSLGERFVLRMEGLPTELHYTFTDGYMVASGTAHRLSSAIEDRQLGATILSSEEFTGVLPKDGEPHFSLIAWQNLGPVLGLLAQGLDQFAGATGGRQGLPPLAAGGLDAACVLHARASDRAIDLSISSADGAGPGAHIAALLRSALAEGLQHAAEAGLLDAARRGPGYDGDSSPAEPADAARTY